MKSTDTIVKTLDTLLHQALTEGASDVHFEIDRDYFRVRFRVDGLLRIAAMPALPIRDAVISRLKVLARMDIAEKRLPQDGRIQYPYLDKVVDLRVSSLPTTYGEKIVVRILNFYPNHIGLAKLGYEPDEEIKLTQAIEQPHGMILMTGPTGSGKTLSLYSCIELLNREELNISTVEDPSEIHLPGVNQVTINERAGLTFSVILRALLRQDPDVIMVGEIRDLETAEIATQAAQTGHLVLSTLHANDAPSTLARLCHMGIPAFNVAASIKLITAQRLVRKLCEYCKQYLSLEEINHFLNQLNEKDTQTIPQNLKNKFKLYKAVGCNMCDKGYKGRIGIYQVMPISETMRSLIVRNSNTQILAAQATREGVRNLRQNGWLKAIQGITSIEEVITATTYG